MYLKFKGLLESTMGGGAEDWVSFGWVGGEDMVVELRWLMLGGTEMFRGWCCMRCVMIAVWLGQLVVDSPRLGMSSG